MSTTFLDDAVILTDGSRVYMRDTAIIASVCNTLVRLQPRLPAHKKCHGVYVYVVPINSGIPMESTMHRLVGPVPIDKMPIYRGHSREKVRRLLLNDCHVLSWQSWDEERELYPGAARSRLRGIGISGLPSAADETIAIEALVDIGDISRGEADLMAAISNNQFYALLNAA